MPRAEWAQVAHDLRALAESIDAAIEPSAARADVQDRVPSRPAAAETGVPPAPASASRIPNATECPKHRKAFTPSKNPDWPAFCSSTTDDPAWGKQKQDRDGNTVLYCRITSKNAAEYAALHSAAQDLADVPF